MRTKNSLYNVIGVVVLYITRMAVNFAGKTVLIKVMGDQYNGLTGLFSSVISVLSIAELGIGSAIIYNLYKPVKENDIEVIKSIMQFYKKCYHTIALIVFFAGLCILPFIKNIIGDVNVKENIYVLYSFFLIDSVASYFLSYKRSIIYVYQKNYIISIFDTVYILTMQILQILAIIITHNYILFLLIMIICRVIENIGIHIYANKNYTFLADKNIVQINEKIKKDIIIKVKGIMFHNVGTYIVLGTDNILIGKLINVIAVGFYSNYIVIFSPISSILKQMINAVQASVGDLLVEKDDEKNYKIFRRLNFANYWLYSTVSVSIFCVIQDFIVLWLGEKYLFSIEVVFWMTLNFWQTGMRNALHVFKGAAGIYYEDRFVPIAESIVNIITSILFASKFGIAGIFMGTFFSSLCLFFYSYPLLVYKKVFNRNIKEYFMSMFMMACEWLILIGISYFISINYDLNINISNKILSFIIKGFLIFSISNLIMLFIHHNSEELNYYINFIRVRVLKK